jgi:hypothetical protein
MAIIEVDMANTRITANRWKAWMSAGFLDGRS